MMETGEIMTTTTTTMMMMTMMKKPLRRFESNGLPGGSQG
jgi:hypothetical protein